MGGGRGGEEVTLLFCFGMGGRVGGAMGEVAGGRRSTSEARSTGEENKKAQSQGVSMRMSFTQERQGKTVLRGSLLREKLKKQEDNLIITRSKQRADAKPTVLPEL